MWGCRTPPLLGGPGGRRYGFLGQALVPCPEGQESVCQAGAAGTAQEGQSGSKARSLSARRVFEACEWFGVMGFWASGGVVRPIGELAPGSGLGDLGQWGGMQGDSLSLLTTEAGGLSPSL